MRFLLFCGHTYYPGQGWDNFGGRSNDPKELIRNAFQHAGDWAQIIDLETDQIILYGKRWIELDDDSPWIWTRA